jgi:tyrosyl-tRNA synthetase
MVNSNFKGRNRIRRLHDIVVHERGVDFANQAFDFLSHLPPDPSVPFHYVGKNIDLFEAQGCDLAKFLIGLDQKELNRLYQMQEQVTRGLAGSRSEHGFGSFILRTNAGTGDWEFDLPEALRLPKENYVLKLGVDPTAPTLHLGQLSLLLILREWQKHDYQVAGIIGDVTGLFPDVSMTTRTRSALAADELAENGALIADQMIRFLDPNLTRIIPNSTWYRDMDALCFLQDVVGSLSINPLIARPEIQQRLQKGLPVGVPALLYCAFQAYDSVMLAQEYGGVGIEFGAWDQLFNILLGREVLKKFGHETQMGAFIELLPGLDGKGKMSKSLGNYIGLDMGPDEAFNGIMGMVDWLIERYTDMLVRPTEAEMHRIRAAMGPMRQALSRGATGVSESNLEITLSRASVLELIKEERLVDRRDPLRQLAPTLVEIERLIGGNVPDNGIDYHVVLDNRSKGQRRAGWNAVPHYAGRLLDAIGLRPVFGESQYGVTRFNIIPRNQATRRALRDLYEREIEAAEGVDLSPLDAKVALATKVVTLTHTKKEAIAAKKRWEYINQGVIPDDLDTKVISGDDKRKRRVDGDEVSYQMLRVNEGIDVANVYLGDLILMVTGQKPSEVRRSLEQGVKTYLGVDGLLVNVLQGGSIVAEVTESGKDLNGINVSVDPRHAYYTEVSIPLDNGGFVARVGSPKHLARIQYKPE